MATLVSSPTFVGRRTELHELQDAVERAAGGEAGMILVAGEAGVGKTRLLEELAGWAREKGCRVLVGGCVSLSAEVAPFAPIIEALRPLAADLGAEELRGILGTNARGLAPLLPDFGPAGEPAGATGISPDNAQGRMLELLLGLLGRLAARSPVVLVVRTCTGRIGQRSMCWPSWPATSAASQCCWWPPSGPTSPRHVGS